jgi:ArsR family transcriptional regulator, arsenate/arsenite/antimonite-responsive transcriptional repressor
MNVVLEAPQDASGLAARFSALAHPARLAILQHLACHDACCCKDVVARMELAQSTVSQHLKVLVEAGLVRFNAEHPRSRYSVDRDALSALSRDVSAMLQSCCTAQENTNP